jgi:NitT/TauT family transport system ATP-binding protein
VVPLSPGTPQPIFEARAVEKWFDAPGGTRSDHHLNRIQALAPTELAIFPDSFVALLGPSGCGKSTLVRILAGLTPPSAGEVLWHGQPLQANPGAARAALVFQNYALFPWLSVQHNVEAPLEALGMPRDERRLRATRMLDLVGLDGFETAYPRELSGGMKQRVGLARALAVEPEVLFMDEPFSSVDLLTAETLRGELLELWREHKLPTRAIFLITHNIEEAVALADRVLVMSRAPGRIRADLAVQLPHPRDRKAQSFINDVDYLYTLLTRPAAEVAAPAAAGRAAARRGGWRGLPHTSPGALSGLLEQLAARGGREDLYRLAQESHMELAELLPALEAASLLGWARVHEGDAELQPEGREFAEAGIQARKEMFRSAALRHVALLRWVHAALRQSREHSFADARLRVLLLRRVDRREAQQQLHTAIAWGRYAELLDYDARSGLLHTPEEAAAPSPHPHRGRNR